MGLAPYGEVQETWLESFCKGYESIHNGDTYVDVLKILGEEIGLNFNANKRFGEKLGRDIAATSQKAFEEVFLKHAKPFLEEYPNLPICISGGCGLNITLNTRIAQEFNRKVFVGPNPNDCGIAAGMLLNEFKPEKPVSLTYSGPLLFDVDQLGEYINSSNFSSSSILDLSILAQDIIEGKIVGVAKDRSEHGPRALGNRSILCNPAIKDMKDTLNSKVKNREAYRPFAPVVRLEDVNKFFEWIDSSEHMNFSPLVREEWRNKLASITHIDFTARIQTVTKDQNSFLYDLLTELDSKTGIGVLLNTSFNVAGKPILNTLKDAFHIFETTKMDSLVIENTYITKI